jgi:hypothetical protein
MRNIKEYLKVEQEKGQSLIGLLVGAVVIILTIYIVIVLIRYLIIPAIFGK